MAVYAYYRVSTQSQVEANGIEMQKDVISKYCKENNIELAGEFSDLGISGTIVDREGITELLTTIESGDQIIVQNTSRLWRSDFAKVMIRHEIEKVKADVISVEQTTYSVYTKDPNDFLINGMMELLDQYEKMSIAMKLAKGRKARAKTGNKPCGTAPIGYIWDGNDIVIDHSKRGMIQDIFMKYIGSRSLEKTRQMCIERGYTTNQGKDFSKQAIKNILENDFYIGIVTYAGKKIDGEHQRIVNKDIFNQANEILKRRTK